jgi:DNA-binding MarR family transcriptional regulator
VLRYQPLRVQESPLPLGLLIAAIGRAVRQLVAAQVEPLGLSNQEFWTLVAVAEHPTASQAELAARQHVDDATTCRVVRALGEAGLLTAVRDPADRRRVRPELTTTGATLARRLVPMAGDIRRTLEASLAPAEREAVRAALARVLARVEARMAAPPAGPPPSRRREAAPSAARAAGRRRSATHRGPP